MIRRIKILEMQVPVFHSTEFDIRLHSHCSQKKKNPGNLARSTHVFHSLLILLRASHHSFCVHSLSFLVAQAPPELVNCVGDTGPRVKQQ